MYDVIIIGGGPAGLTAGIYCCRANLSVLILEANSLGGQIATSPKVENYPGYESISGIDLINKFYSQYEKLGGKVIYSEAIKIIKKGTFTITCSDGEYHAKSVIFAAGAHHRHLNIPNEEKFAGEGVSYCATCDGAFYKDATVAVVGGGNSAVISALHLSNIAKKVYLLCRSEKLSAEKVLIEKLQAKENVRIEYMTEVKELEGNTSLTGIIISKNDKNISLPVDGLFVSIGMDANSKILKDLVSISNEGYIESIDTLTSVKGLFIAGDVRTKTVRQLTTATSDGTIAAMNAIDYLNKL